MSYEQRMLAACEASRQATSGHRQFTGPASEHDIQRTEQLIGLPITGSFRTFVERLGSQNDFGFCGVNTEYGDEAGTAWVTRILREEGLPEHYLAVWQDESGGTTCVLDTSVETAHGEHPVYELFAPSWQDTIRKIFDSFVEFFEYCYQIPAVTQPETTSAEARASVIEEAGVVTPEATAPLDTPATARRPTASPKKPKRKKAKAIKAKAPTSTKAKAKAKHKTVKRAKPAKKTVKRKKATRTKKSAKRVKKPAKRVKKPVKRVRKTAKRKKKVQRRR